MLPCFDLAYRHWPNESKRVQGNRHSHVAAREEACPFILLINSLRSSKITCVSSISVNGSLYFVSVSEQSVLKLWSETSGAVVATVDVGISDWESAGNTLGTLCPALHFNFSSYAQATRSHWFCKTNRNCSDDHWLVCVSGNPDLTNITDNWQVKIYRPESGIGNTVELPCVSVSYMMVTEIWQNSTIREK